MLAVRQCLVRGRGMGWVGAESAGALPEAWLRRPGELAGSWLLAAERGKAGPSVRIMLNKKLHRTKAHVPACMRTYTCFCMHAMRPQRICRFYDRSLAKLSCLLSRLLVLVLSWPAPAGGAGRQTPSRTARG